MQLISLGRYYRGPRGQGPGPGTQLAPRDPGAPPCTDLPCIRACLKARDIVVLDIFMMCRINHQSQGPHPKLHIPCCLFKYEKPILFEGFMFGCLWGPWVPRGQLGPRPWALAPGPPIITSERDQLHGLLLHGRARLGNLSFGEAKKCPS